MRGSVVLWCHLIPSIFRDGCTSNEKSCEPDLSVQLYKEKEVRVV